MDSRSSMVEPNTVSDKPAHDEAASSTSAAAWQPERWSSDAQPSNTPAMPYYSQYGSQNDSQYSTMQSYDSPRRGRARPAWLTGIVLVLAVIRLLSHLGGSSNASSYTYTPPTDSQTVTPGVTVCSVENISLFPLGCLYGESSVALKSGAVLSYAGLSGATFGGPVATFTVQRLDAKGKVLAHGTSTDKVSTGDVSSFTAVDDVIHQAGLTLIPGTYMVDARVGSTDLGSTTFTLTAKTK